MPTAISDKILQGANPPLMTAEATALVSTFAEGNQVPLLTDLAGNLLVSTAGSAGSAVSSGASSTISSGGSVTPTIALGNNSLVGIIMPVAWTAAALSIEVSMDGTNWVSTLYDSYSAQTGYYSTPVAGAAYAADILSIIGFKYIRLRSGTAAAPVNQAANRVFSIITKPLS